MSEFKIEKVEQEVLVTSPVAPTQYQMFDIVEMEDEFGKKVKIKQRGMYISREDLIQQEENLKSQLAQVKEKIKMIDAIK